MAAPGNNHETASLATRVNGSRKLVAAGGLAILGFALAALFVWRGSAPLPVALAPVTVALPTQINSAPLIVAADQGLFQKSGVEIKSLPLLLGKDALKSVLDGKADRALVASAPFTFAVLEGHDIRGLAGNGREKPVSRQYEPRNSHADERRYRHAHLAQWHAAQRGNAIMRARPRARRCRS